MKQISGFSVIGINNGLRLTYTYDELNDSGEMLSQNVRKSFYIMDETVKENVENIFNFIKAREDE